MGAKKKGAGHGGFASLGRKWAAQMKAYGEKVRGRRAFIMAGHGKVVALHWFRDTVGNVTVFTDTGKVLQFLRREVIGAPER